VAILPKPACIWRFDERDRNTGALHLHNVADVERVGADTQRCHAIHSADLERCRLCGAPAAVELFAGYWLCRLCCDRLGREAM
jgi:ribosomal protein S14